LNRARYWVAMLCGVLIAGVAGATDDEPDAELLEFLGGWEGEDDEWQEFFDSLPVALPDEAADSNTDDRSTTHDSN